MKTKKKWTKPAITTSLKIKQTLSAPANGGDGSTPGMNGFS